MVSEDSELEVGDKVDPVLILVVMEDGLGVWEQNAYNERKES